MKIFVEKRSAEVARSLIRGGALWNGFILVVRASALVRIFERHIPEIVLTVRDAIERDRGQTAPGLATIELYGRLPEIDFSRQIVQGHESELCVLRMPQCGWRDLGTPVRVAETLRRAPPCAQRTERSSAYLNLSSQYAAQRATR